MSANRLFLVCSHHQHIEDAFCLGERADTDRRYDCNAALGDYLDEWLRKHAACGNGPDHFQLAYHRPQNHDWSKPAEPVPNAVRLALVNGGSH